MKFKVVLVVVGLVIILVFYYYYTYHYSSTKQSQQFIQKRKINDYQLSIGKLQSLINQQPINQQPINHQPINHQPINQQPSIKQLVDSQESLFQLYNTGIPSTYSQNGEKIDGIEPDAIAAIDTLLKLFELTGDNGYTLKLAKIYHHGMHKFEPNLDEAYDTYLHIYNSTNNSRTKQEAFEGMKDIEKLRAYKWLNLPVDNEQPVIPPVTVPLITMPHIIPFIDDYEMGVQAIDEKKYNDPQNTHNPGVIGTLKKSFDLINKETPDTINQLYEIEQYLNTLPKTDKLLDAQKALKHIKTNNIRVDAIDSHEVDTLNTVWSRIKQLSNKDTDLRENLVTELSEMVEHGEVVCPTGRTSRLINSLNGIDPLVDIKPTYAIKEEMLSKAAVIRNSLGEQIDDYTLKEQIRETLKKEYVDTKILTPERFIIETDWIEHI